MPDPFDKVNRRNADIRRKKLIFEIGTVISGLDEICQKLEDSDISPEHYELYIISGLMKAEMFIKELVVKATRNRKYVVSQQLLSVMSEFDATGKDGTE